MPDTVPVPIDCPACGGHLTAFCGPEDPAYKPQQWRCPYCHKLQWIDLRGPILVVVKRSDSR